MSIYKHICLKKREHLYNYKTACLWPENLSTLDIFLFLYGKKNMEYMYIIYAQDRTLLSRYMLYLLLLIHSGDKYGL